MSFSHIIQSEDDYQISDSESLQLIIQTANPVKLSTFQCENLSIFIEYNHKYFRGFLDYVHYKQLLNSLSHLQLKSFAWKHGVNNQFSDEDADSLAAFIRSQKCLDTLNLSFDQNNKITAKGIRSLLSAIAELHLKHLSLVFDDEIQLNLEDLQLIYRIQLLSLNLSFGQEVCSNQSWHQLKPQMANLQKLSLLIRPYNKLDKSFSIYLSSLKTHSQLQHLNVTISSGTDIDEASIKSLSEVIKEMQNLQSLSFFLHDTRQFTQDVFDQLSSSFKQLNNLNLNLGYNLILIRNNHHIKSYDKLYDSLQNIHNIQFKFGQNYNLISSKLFQSNKMKIIDIRLQIGSQVQTGCFKSVGEVFAKAEKVRIEFADGKDCPDLELIDLIGQVSKQSDVKVFSENKLVRMIDQTLQIQLDQIPSIKVLFNTLYSKLEFLQNLKISIKSTLIEQESIDQIVKQLQQSDLKVLSITIKRLNNFQCNQIIEFFAQLVQVKQWAFLSIEIANKCILQLYGKSSVNQQVNLQIHTGLKLGQSGLDNMSKALKAINVTELRLTILNENQLSESGIKGVSTALLYSTNLSKITFQILDTNPSVQQYVGKAQATINQYIKDKSKLQKTYSSLLQREWEQHKTEISAQMLQGISDYLIDDIQLPAIPAGQYHNQQYGFGSSWNPQSIIDIFDQ